MEIEIPDFDSIALRLVTQGKAHDQISLVEQLREVWNARGAADLVILEADLSTMMGATAAGPYVKNLDRAIRRLDR